ncbi:MAG: low molecular weight protein-tyrosine-phosphatase [Tenacibaculum sp.]
MVCLGNICRSPLAEGILKSKVDLTNIVVDSAGTAEYHIGEPPDKRSVAVAKKYGIDIGNQRSRKFTLSDFNNFDIIYSMDKSNYQNIVSLAQNTKDSAKVKLILKELYPDKNLEIPDPYYGKEQDFEDVYKILNKVCTVIACKLKKSER